MYKVLFSLKAPSYSNAPEPLTAFIFAADQMPELTELRGTRGPSK